MKLSEFLFCLSADFQMASLLFSQQAPRKERILSMPPFLSTLSLLFSCRGMDPIQMGANVQQNWDLSFFCLSDIWGYSFTSGLLFMHCSLIPLGAWSMNLEYAMPVHVEVREDAGCLPFSFFVLFV